MPIYQYQCDKDSGCGFVWEFCCLMSEFEDNKPKLCPNCKSKDGIHQCFGDIIVSVPKTLGSLADKNSRQKSLDEKIHLHNKHNEYKQAPPSWESTPDGMIHKPSISKD